MIDVGKKIFRR